MKYQYDDIVVGAGSSGAVLAARLSEDPRRRVLLLEAGADFATLEETPAGVLNANRDLFSGYHWNYPTGVLGERVEPCIYGKVVGGSSAVNGCIALRGDPDDYDEWAELGNPGWGFKDVLPSLRKLEDDQDMCGDVHGQGGPVPIRRWRREELHPIHQAFFTACRNHGFAETQDFNSPRSSGVGPFPMNIRNGMRISTAIAYLLPARSRPNLTLRANCHVHRLLFDGRRVSGVELACGGTVERILGQRVTLSAGALSSPAILLRSGIGPQAALNALAIPPLVDLPGVGANLTDHAMIRVELIPKREYCAVDDPPSQIVARYAAPGSTEHNDMQLYTRLFPRLPHEVAAVVGTERWLWVNAVLHRPRSRGVLSLSARDPQAPPKVSFRLLDAPEDVHRLITGLRLAWQVAHSLELAPYVERLLTPKDVDMESEAAVSAYLRAAVAPGYHAAGSARMGPDSDPMAVVDGKCQVYGVGNLFVADASIMPTIPRANLNLTCMMIGERVAEWMCGS